MGRPLGSKNKPIFHINTLSPDPLAAVKAIEKLAQLPDRKQFTDSIHYDEILAIRVLRKGQFRGLWELVRLDDQGKVKQVLTDANSRGMVINMVNRSIMRIVAAM